MRRLKSPKATKVQKGLMEREFEVAYKKHAKGKHPSKDIMQKVALTAMSRLKQGMIRELVEQFENKGVAFQKKLQKHFKMVMDDEKKKASVLPAGTRYFLRTSDAHLYVVEQGPQVKSVFARDYYEYDKKEKRRFSISLPYVVFFITLHAIKGNFHYAPAQVGRRTVKGPKVEGPGFQGFNCQCFFRNSPLRSLDDVLYSPPIPNREDPFIDLMCLGKTHTPYPMDPFAAVRWVIELFYNTVFTGHVEDWGNNGVIRSKKVENFAAWEKATKKSPLFTLKVKWKKNDTLRGMIAKSQDYLGTFDDGWLEEEDLMGEIEEFMDNLFLLMGGE